MYFFEKQKYESKIHSKMRIMLTRYLRGPASFEGFGLDEALQEARNGSGNFMRHLRVEPLVFTQPGSRDRTESYAKSNVIHSTRSKCGGTSSRPAEVIFGKTSIFLFPRHSGDAKVFFRRS